MTIYVDDSYIARRGRHWCHLMSDGDDEELHQFAQEIGLQRSWFQGDHYDVTRPKRWLAVRNGAIEVPPIKLVEIRKLKRKQGKTNK